MSVMGSEQDREHQKDPVGSKYVMAYCVLFFIAGGRKVNLQLVAMNVPKRRHSSTSVETAVANDDSIENAFVTVLFTLGWLGV